MARKTKQLSCFTTIRVVVEGDTEEEYFSQLKSFERIQGLTIYPFKSKHSDIGHILDQAIKDYNESVYDYIWCVFDDDAYVNTNIPKEVKDKKKNAENMGIMFADSFPAFEIWLLLHFRMPALSYSNQDKVIQELKKYMPAYCKESKWLQKTNLYSLLKQNQVQALDNSKRLEIKNQSNSNKDNYRTICNVHKIIEQILSYKK